MRLWVGIAIIASFFMACGSNQGVHSAEVLPTPLTGVVLKAEPGRHRCSVDGCLVIYRLRFTNPMDHDVSVQECRLVDRALRLLVVGAGPGASVAAHATITVGGTFLLPITKHAAKGLSGSEITCTGLDWHGDPPL